MIGRTISHYRILEKLGEGGMGVVYRAEDTKLKRAVALKFLPPELTRDPEAKERFIQEAQAASALDHPNICNIHEIDETADGRLFICMAYYEGETLKDKIERGALEAREAVRIAMQVGEGLAKAHSRGIVHRDIKPANIVVTDEGVAKILDFGLAKLAGQIRLTKVSSTLGTVAYMSPEQSCGDAVDHRTDIWSLGVVLFEMLTGRLPFKGEFEQAMIYSILNEEPLSLGACLPGAPKELQSVLVKALAKEPEGRYGEVREMLADLAAVDKELEAPAAASGNRPDHSKKRIPLAVAGCAIVAAAIILGRIFLFSPPEKPITSVAVLPFQNLSADPEQEYFSDGMTDALIAELSKIKALRVISRTSVMRFKKSEKSLPEIAKQLSVDAVVEGSIQRIRDEVRVTAQLVRAAPEKHLWANTYMRSFENILSLESDMAHEIAREIRITVTPEEKERFAASRPVNPVAYEAYLKGHYHLYKWNRADVEKGTKYLEQAIALDSTYAPAYVDLAEAHWYMSAGLSPRKLAQTMSAYARKALSIDPTMAHAYAILGDLKLTYDYDWEGAKADYRRAIAMNPNDPVAHSYYGQYLSVMGRHEEALQEVIRAKELDPLDLSIRLSLANRYLYNNECDKAEAVMQEMLSMDSTFAFTYLVLGRLREEEGRFDEAIRHIQKAGTLGEAFYSEQELAPVLARSGKTEEARRMLADMIRQSEMGYQRQVVIAATYLALGERDSSFYWLDKAYELRDGDLPYVRINKRFDDIRSDQRYIAFMKQMGLEP
jgi:serine/threonine-protein kinase